MIAVFEGSTEDGGYLYSERTLLTRLTNKHWRLSGLSYHPQGLLRGASVSSQHEGWHHPERAIQETKTDAAIPFPQYSVTQISHDSEWE